MQQSVFEKLHSITVPEAYSRQQAHEQWTQGLFGMLQDSLPPIPEIIRTLRDAELAETITAGYLTLAMIKPDIVPYVDTSEDPVPSDPKTVNFLKQQIEPPLSIALAVSLTMIPAMVDEFYGDVIERIRQNPPFQPERYGQSVHNGWEENRALMTHGPSTFLLLFSSVGQAVEKWREQMGNHWNIAVVKERFPHSLRARFGKDPYNNLFHGSNSPEGAKREISLLANFLELLSRREG